MTTGESLYDVLGVDEDASEAEIRAAYHELAKKWHPDRFHDPGERGRAEARLKEINAAKDVLLDGEGRAAYDGELAARRKPKPFLIPAHVRFDRRADGRIDPASVWVAVGNRGGVVTETVRWTRTRGAFWKLGAYHALENPTDDALYEFEFCAIPNVDVAPGVHSDEVEILLDGVPAPLSLEVIVAPSPPKTAPSAPRAPDSRPSPPDIGHTRPPATASPSGSAGPPISAAPIILLVCVLAVVALIATGTLGAMFSSLSPAKAERKAFLDEEVPASIRGSCREEEPVAGSDYLVLRCAGAGVSDALFEFFPTSFNGGSDALYGYWDKTDDYDNNCAEGHREYSGSDGEYLVTCPRTSFAIWGEPGRYMGSAIGPNAETLAREMLPNLRSLCINAEGYKDYGPATPNGTCVR